MGADNILKVLIIDDEPDTVDLFSTLLRRKMSATSESAVDCATAREMLSSSSFDLIMLDYRLPDGNGIELLKEIESSDKPPPVIMVTGHGDEKTAIDAFRLGVTGYVTKDSGISGALVEEVESALARGELERADIERAEAEARLRELYDSSVEGIGILGSNGRFEYVNKSLAEMFGYSTADRFLDTDVTYSYVDPVERRKLQKILMEKGSVRGYEINVRRKDGSTFWVLANITMYKDEAGNPLRTASFLTDITEIKQAEEEMKRINEELEAYAHTMSHDLKGPLAAIGIAVNLLDPEMVDVKDGESEEILEIIRRNTGIAQKRVDNILKLAESGQKPTEVEEVDVGEVVGEVLQVMSHQIEAKNITIHVDKEMGKLTANRPQIEQLFSNLISNAVKHNKIDNPEIRIAHLGDDGGGAHRYMVKDNGEGIPPAQLKGLFDPFRKGGKTGEAGLGLSIARKIVAVYGGDIKARNDNGACLEFGLKDYAPADKEPA